MNKVSIAAIIGILVILLGGGVLVLSQRSNNQTPMPKLSSTSPTPEQVQLESSKSLKDLFSMGNNQECKFSDGSGNSGTVYVANGKMRGDFITTQAQGSINSHILVENNTSYIWMDNQSTGFKMSFDTTAQAEAQKEVDTLDLDKKINYECSNWTVNSSLFNKPTQISFTDLGQLTIPSLNPSATGDSKSLQCSSCNSLPSEAQAACKKVLSCE